MTDLRFVLLLVAGIALLLCVTKVVLAALNRSCSAEHDLKRRALGLLAAMTAVPAIALYVARSAVTGFVAIAVALIWGVVFLGAMRIVFRVDPPP